MHAQVDLGRQPLERGALRPELERALVFKDLHADVLRKTAVEGHVAHTALQYRSLIGFRGRPARGSQ